jgi:hypothetical protein
MALIIWGDELSIGLKSIDAEHKKLISLMIYMKQCDLERVGIASALSTPRNSKIYLREWPNPGLDISRRVSAAISQPKDSETTTCEAQSTHGFLG